MTRLEAASRPIRWIVRESREANRTDSPAFYRTNFARAPARQSDGLTFGIPSPAFPRTDFARIRKADANSTISQPRYGRNQPPRNHEPTILRVEYKNDFDTTIPHSRFSKSDNVELHGFGLSINCLGRRVTSYTTRDAKEIAKLLAMVP